MPEVSNQAAAITPTGLGASFTKKVSPKVIGDFISSLTDERIANINVYGNNVTVNYTL